MDLVVVNVVFVVHEEDGHFFSRTTHRHRVETVNVKVAHCQTCTLLLD